MRKNKSQKDETGKTPGAERGSPVVTQVREHVIEQAGDEGHGLLLLITAVNHVQQRGQDLHKAKENSSNPQLPLLAKGESLPRFRLEVCAMEWPPKDLQSHFIHQENLPLLNNPKNPPDERVSPLQGEKGLGHCRLKEQRQKPWKMVPLLYLKEAK